MGHEAPETAETQIVAVSAFVHMLFRVEAGDRQAVFADRGKGNLLQAGESSLALVRMI